MKNLLKTTAIFLCFLSLQAVAQQYPKNFEKAEKLITPALMQSYINVLASDANLGRNTPSPGLDSAAQFIVRTFKAENIKPFNGNYFQTITLNMLDLDAGNSFSISQNGMITEQTLCKDFVPFEQTANGAVSAQAVFVGYGLTVPERNYDDYAGMDVSGKAVVIMRGTPWGNRYLHKRDTSKTGKYDDCWYKFENARKHGAAAVYFTYEFYKDMPSLCTELWPALDMKTFMTEKELQENSAAKHIPVVCITDEVLGNLCGGMEKITAIEKQIYDTQKPLSRVLESVNLSCNVAVKNEGNQLSQNVIAYIEGSDPKLKNEVVIIGAHYDHVGYMAQHTANEDYIMNGADDNASGSAGVMAVAKAVKALKQKPKRSMLFIWFMGEERGLLGSKYYVVHPALPLKNTAAMLNMDMISRNAPDTLILEGAFASPDVTEFIKTANKGVGFKLENGKYLGGSDHYNFYLNNIPFMFFFTGLHKDYHQVGDNPNTINAEKAARVARVILRTALLIANDNKRYRVIKQDE